MNKNEIGLFLSDKPEFTDVFCKNKYKTGNKCKKYYENEISKKMIHISVCPYGYACVFGPKYIYSSIIDDEHSNLNLIKKRFNYNRRAHGDETQLKILKSKELDELLNEIQNGSDFEEYKSTFHDLNNNHRYLLDNYNVLDDDLKQIYQIDVLSLSNIYLNHKKKLENAISTMEKYDIYLSEINDIDEINKRLLERINSDNKNVLDFKSSLEFNDFRIRYLRRITNSTINDNDSMYLKDISIYKILTKLKYAFSIPSKKKNQAIKLNQSNDYSVLKVYDDIYVAFFILFENAVKYAPFNSIIDVKYFFNNNDKIEIVFENYSDNVGNTSKLLERGIQGDNHKEGNGLGLAIAFEIFKKSGFNLDICYKNGKFICDISKSFQ